MRSRPPSSREAQRRGLAIDLVRNGSRGLFWLEPMVEVETPAGRVAYGPVAAGDVLGLFEAGFLEGGAHGLAHGPTEEIAYLKQQERLTFARCGITDPLSLEDYRGPWRLRRAEAGAWPWRRGDRRAGDALGPARARRRRLSRRHQMEDGAARPPGRAKIHRLQRRRRRQRHLCRPHADGRRSLLPDRGHDDRRPRRGRERGLRLYPLRISPCLPPDGARHRDRARTPAGWAPMSRAAASAFDIELRLGAGAYICGEETSLLESLEGKRGIIRYKPPLPAIKGLFGKPTVINNVITLASVPIILARGAEFYRDYGMGRSRGTLPIQLAGNVKHGGLVEKAFGLTLRELIEDFGGGTASGRPLRAVQVGGPLGAYFPASAARYAARLRGLRRREGHGRPWRRRGLRRHRRSRPPGALRHGVLRHRILRQMHALPHRLDPRRRGDRQDHRRRAIAVEQLDLLQDLCDDHDRCARSARWAA